MNKKSIFAVLAAVSILALGVAYYLWVRSGHASRAHVPSAVPIAKLATYQATVPMFSYIEPVLDNLRYGVAVVGIFILVLVIIRARRNYLERLMQSPHLVTPANFANWVNSVVRANEHQGAALSKLNERLVQSDRDIHENIQNLSQTFLKLQTALDFRDEQLRRAEQGLQLALLRKHLRRFVLVDACLHEESNKDAQTKLEQVRALLRDALEECGVETYSPSLGVDFRTEKNVSDQPLLFPTSDSSLHYQVRAVISEGYRANTETGFSFIVHPAKVEIYSPRDNI